jgi:hypothetical protein
MIPKRFVEIECGREAAIDTASGPKPAAWHSTVESATKKVASNPTTM